MKKTLKILIPLLGMVIIAAVIMHIANISKDAAVLDFFKPEKFTRIKNVNITGREGDGKSWKIRAEECWTGRDRHTSIFENVSSCTIFEDDYPIVKDLTARRIIVNSRNKDIEIFKEVDGKGWLKARIDFNRANNKPDYSTLYADYIKFNPNTDKGLIKGNITIIKEDLTIEAEEIDMDLDKNIAQIKQESKYIKGDNIIIGRSATAFLNKDIIDISSVEVYQQNKMAFAESGTLDDQKRIMTLKNNVEAIIEKTAEALKKSSVERITATETKKALEEKTVINCDEMTLNFDDKNFTAKGEVLVTQKGKRAKADFAEYSEDSEDIILTGNVYMERKDSWVKANKVIVSVKDETFHAMGEVETEFMITK